MNQDVTHELHLPLLSNTRVMVVSAPAPLGLDYINKDADDSVVLHQMKRRLCKDITNVSEESHSN